ncbi:hypothetical protein D3C76_1277770 [compost metagenome]
MNATQRVDDQESGATALFDQGFALIVVDQIQLRTHNRIDHQMLRNRLPCFDAQMTAHAVQTLSQCQLRVFACDVINPAILRRVETQ